MSVKSMDLVWITVDDFDEAIQYYTEVLGLEVADRNDDFGWAELVGKDGGARLGICEECDTSPVGPGENAVLTMSVDNLDKTLKQLSGKIELEGDICEVPGHVRMQLIRDPSGNLVHLVEKMFS
jgi:predicted enzyme related to lactoylglutathione lyase